MAPITVNIHCIGGALEHVWVDCVPFGCCYVSQGNNSQVHPAIIHHSDLVWFEAGISQHGIHYVCIPCALETWEVCLVQLQVGSNSLQVLSHAG